MQSLFGILGSVGRLSMRRLRLLLGAALFIGQTACVPVAVATLAVGDAVHAQHDEGIAYGSLARRTPRARDTRRSGDCLCTRPCSRIL